MKAPRLVIGAAFALTSAWVLAQDAPESLLPPSFDRPAARPPAPQPSGTPRIESQPLVQATPQSGVSTAGAAGDAEKSKDRVPTLSELEALSPDDLGDLLGIKPKFDMPAGSRRALSQVGVIGEAEGGLPAASLARQNASLVAATIKGNKGQVVSRWGHILLRRALASRLDVPTGMNPTDFAAMRAALLVRMGEGEAARAVVQDVDTGNYTPDLTQAAFDAYVATADFTGICPAAVLQGGIREDGYWEIARATCAVFRGEGNPALKRLDRAISGKGVPKVDGLLAQKYAGAAGTVRRAVKVEWDGVTDMTPWRYGMAIAVGIEVPAELLRGAPLAYDTTAATAPMLGLPTRAAAADRAAAAGKLSSAAMVDLYSQIYAQEDVGDDWSKRAGQLRAAYLAPKPAGRLAAIKALWDGVPGETQRYSRQVLTAYAAARLPVEEEFAEAAPALIASMLAAGLDRNALRWAPQAPVGSEAWALLALAAPKRNEPVEASAVNSFEGNDESEGSRKTAFLFAGLAGLDRLSPEARKDLAEGLGIDLDRKTRWSAMIDRAAAVNNRTLVVLLAGIGMQGNSWDRMTARHLYHIVAALKAVGLEAEARMIAAEAVARG